MMMMMMMMMIGQGAGTQTEHGRQTSQKGLHAAGDAGHQPSLEEHLMVYTAADTDPVPAQLLRKYIAYARAYVHPSLSREAKEVCL
jgi:DNA helicase MCM8